MAWATHGTCIIYTKWYTILQRYILQVKFIFNCCKYAPSCSTMLTSCQAHIVVKVISNDFSVTITQVCLENLEDLEKPWVWKRYLENLKNPWIPRFLRPRTLENPKYPMFSNVTLFERLNCVTLPLQVYDWLGCKISLSELFYFPVNILLSKFLLESFSFLYCIDFKTIAIWVNNSAKLWKLTSFFS